MLKVANGIFIKQSVDLAGLRQATKPLMKHVLRGRGADPAEVAKQFGTGFPTTTRRGSSMVFVPHTKQISGNLAGKILQPVGGAFSNFVNMAKEKNSPELLAALKNMSPKAKEMFNRVALLHEGSERAFAPKSIKGMFDLDRRWFSHISPSVIGQESNVLASMPKGIDYTQVRNAFQTARKASGELDWANKTITPKGYGQARLSRHGTKAMTQSWFNKLPRINDVLMRRGKEWAELVSKHLDSGAMNLDPATFVERLKQENPHLFGVPEF